MKGLRLFFLVIITGTLFACHVTPYSVYDLKVSDKTAETLWLNGKELLKLSNDEAEIVLNYDTSEQGMLIFDLSILNKKEDIILISPENFYCNTDNRLGEKNQISAINPEVMIGHYSKRIEELRARKKSASREDLVFSLFDVADGFKSKTDEERQKEREEKRDREETQERKVENINSDLDSYDKIRQSFEIEALRKTSLVPGQKVNGKIYFPIRASLTKFNLTIPIAEQKFRVNYHIEKI